MFGAKLSWCQIVRCQIVLVPNCPGAKLSTFIILVPNCPLLLSWCQIVRFIILVPNCPVPNCPVPNCPVPNCPTIQITLLFFIWKGRKSRSIMQNLETSGLSTQMGKVEKILSENMYFPHLHFRA